MHTYIHIFHDLLPKSLYQAHLIMNTYTCTNINTHIHIHNRIYKNLLPLPNPHRHARIKSHLRLGTKLLEVAERHDFSTNEASLEVGVNCAGSLGSLAAFTQHPRLYLVGSCTARASCKHACKRI